MATETEDAGFLSRWSRRKALVQQGAVLPAPAALAVPANVPAAPPAGAPLRAAAPQAAAARGDGSADIGTDATPTPPAPPPPPTLADVATLTRDSDYSRFVGRSVQPDVRNAALGKLFADPHFNVMDGLDVYIDDYGKPDPLPEGMLRQMLQAHVLGLFDDDEEKPPPPTTPALPAAAAPMLAEPAADENTDLQLQPDDDAGRPGLAPGAGEDAGRAH
jgi:Protein of unknown function (DUF3306)